MMTYRMRLYLNHMHRLDSHVCVAVNHTSQYRLIRDVFRLVSQLGDGVFWYGLMVAIFIFEGAESVTPVVHMCLAGLAGTLLYKWLKGKTLRPRPYEVHQDIWLTGTPLDQFSFPSGHTLHAVIFSAIAISYYPQLSIIVMPFTLLVGLSRVILGLHYPSDVLAGASIGALVAWVSFWVI